MQISDLKYVPLTDNHLKPYAGRAQDHSAQFILWFLENVFRLEEQDAIDAVVDATMDKGIDAVFADQGAETIYIFQSKLNSKENGRIPENDLKDFYASLQQFKTADGINNILNGNANQKLKDLLVREKIKDKIISGFSVQGIFCSNVEISPDAKSFLKNIDGIDVYDADKICDKYVDIAYNGGVNQKFVFDTSATDIIKYEPAANVVSYIFLSRALQLVHLSGIADGTLFERNVRLSLGNTKVNRGLFESIGNKKEHKNFPLYHNGINIICELVSQQQDQITIENYTVVNGAQSLTSLFNNKSKLTDDLKIVVKIVGIKNDAGLSDKITTNSNNQNSIKARDMRSNHGIQQRLKTEIDKSFPNEYFYEVKRGEKSNGLPTIVNEDVGLFILAMDLGQPYNCHQKYKVMDELHGDIFGRPSLDGFRIVAMFQLGKIAALCCSEIDDKPFASYTLTKYFVAHLAWALLTKDATGINLTKNIGKLVQNGKFVDFLKDFELLARTVALDLNATFVTAAGEGRIFDYKTNLKSATWCNEITTEAITSYKKMVIRKQAASIESIAKKYI